MKRIISNWKMNPETLKEAVALVQASDNEQLIIAAPFHYLATLKGVVQKSPLCAQDVFWENGGAFTGEVSMSQLKSLGVDYCIVGHSERRNHLHETDEMIAKKVAAVVQADGVPILCIGETKEERDAGTSKEIVKKQLESGFSLLENHTSPHIIIAYEPVWAISTEKDAEADDPEKIVEMIHYIKELLTAQGVTEMPQIIYGGSITSENAGEFFQHNEIEGALVGGASLKSDEINKIITIAKQHES